MHRDHHRLFSAHIYGAAFCLLPTTGLAICRVEGTPTSITTEE